MDSEYFYYEYKFKDRNKHSKYQVTQNSWPNNKFCLSTFCLANIISWIPVTVVHLKIVLKLNHILVSIILCVLQQLHKMLPCCDKRKFMNRF